MDPLYSYSVGIAGQFPHDFILTITITMFILLQSKEVDFEILWPSKKTLKLF